MVNPLNGAKRDCYGRTVRRGGRGVRDGRVGVRRVGAGNGARHGAGGNGESPGIIAPVLPAVFDLYVLLSSEGGGKITALHDRCGSPISLS